MQGTFVRAIYLCMLFLCVSCSTKISIALAQGGSKQDRAFTQSALHEAANATGYRLKRQNARREPNTKESDLVVDFFSSWEFEHQDRGIIVSKKWYVPQTALLPHRELFRGVTLQNCFDESTQIIPLEQLNPPFVAAKVDNLTLSNSEYPLVLKTAVRVRVNEGAKQRTKRAIKMREKAAAALSAYLQSMAKPLAPNDPDAPALVWITAAGDLMLGRGAENLLLREGAEKIFGKSAALLREADIALVNLEGAVSSRGTKAAKTFNFRFSPQVTKALADAGIDAVLFANNHSFDYGRDAFLDSLTHIKEAGMGVLGAGTTIDEASRAWNKSTTAFTARVFGIASFPREASGWDGAMVAAEAEKEGILYAARGGKEKLIAALKPEAAPPDVLNIVLFHGGEEWSHRPDERTKTLYTEIIDAGADLVIGSHPHIVQGFEFVHGKPVFWSLGNFVFAGMENTGGGDTGLIIRLGYYGKTLVYAECFDLVLTGPRSDLK
jgi:poly-gamma-glutamate synthesis protein (capsule biosynthesis protein)